MSYKSPKLTVDGVILEDGKILLIKRKNKPFEGKWALPGGFVNYGEKTEDAVIREIFEEVGLKTEIGIDAESDFIYIKDNKKQLDRFMEDFWIFEKVFKTAGWSQKRIEKYKRDTRNRIKKGLSFSFTPCFYAIGKKI